MPGERFARVLFAVVAVIVIAALIFGAFVSPL
jgi:hypothetical protein